MITQIRNMDSTKRIDKGISRKVVDRTAKAGKTVLAVRVTEEQREAIKSDTYPRLELGETTDQIAESHNVPGSTLRYWLVNDPQATKARLSLVNAEMMRTATDMKEAVDPLALARAREEFRVWSFLAERRFPELYGQKQEVTHKSPDPLRIVVSAPQTGLKDVIQGDVISVECSQVIDTK